MDGNNRSQKKRIVSIAGKCLSLAAFVFIFLALRRGYADFSDSHVHIRIHFLLLSLAFGVVYFLCRSFSWASLSRMYAFKIPFYKSMWHLTSSEILRYIPGNVWGLSARVVKAPVFGIPQKSAAALLLEDAVLLTGSASVMIIALLQFSAISHQYKLLLYAISCVLIVGCGVYYLFRKAIFRLFRKDAQDVLTPEKSFSFHIIKTVFIYCLTWTSFGFINVFALSAIGLSIPVITVICIAIFSWLIGYLSLITPMGLGVREGATVVLSTQFIGSAASALFSIVSRMILVLAEFVFYVVAMVVFFTYEKKASHSNRIERGS